MATSRAAPAALLCLFAGSLASGQATIVTDLIPGASGSAPNDLVVVQDRLFFRASAPSVGQEPIRSDGTASGTAVIDDLRPGGAGSNPQRGVAVGNRLFFAANDGSTGDEPWVIDGTSAGTLRLAGSSTPRHLRNVAGLLLFQGTVAASGTELYRYTPELDLSASLSATPASPHETGLLDLRLTLSNAGPGAATQVSTTLTLPAGVSVVSSSASQGSFSASGLWSISGPLDPGTPATLDLRLRLPAGTSTLSFSSSGLTRLETDTDPTNDAANLAVTPATYDLSLGKAVDDATPADGQVVSYTTSVANQSGETVALEVLEQLAPGFALQTSAPSLGSYDGVANVWSLSLAPGGSATLRLSGAISGSAGSALASVATIRSSASASHLDGDASNDRASVTLTIAPSASPLATPATTNQTGRGGGSPLPRARRVISTTTSRCAIGAAPQASAWFLLALLLLAFRRDR